KAVGPVHSADLEALFSAGELGLETLVWRDGFTNWERASAALQLAPAPEAKRRRFPIARFLLLVCATILGIALATAMFFAASPILELETPSLVSAAWSALVAAIAIACGLSIAGWWRFADDVFGHASARLARRGGAIKSVCIFAASIALMVVIAGF